MVNITRKFNGKVYKQVSEYTKKEDAQASAIRHRYAGRKARVVKVGRKWVIFMRGK